MRESANSKNKGGQVEVAPKQQTRELRATSLPFEFLRTPIAERLV